MAGRISTYTSGCAKTQKRCCHNNGSPAAARGSLDDARPYLFKAILNGGCNHVGGTRRRLPWTDDTTLLPDVRSDMELAVATLPKRQRVAVYLRYWRDLPIAEVSSLMDAGQGNGRSPPRTGWSLR